ncbi:hypothetical protein [Sulfitobacter mediterraneus]|jgi:hypothetical protein|uniref:Uncharacterized protein n=1 Tax=Sulfitobacter mediterraneus TaxID=83219 RepID=A0A2T6CD53_9RHOB|nr:hypothetical protein [Sulfitobacter mediterraneus]KIN79577.1 hypothetical protein Z950_110 [Sulfitobacter mediterraneus KCTC 32188]PTX73436.1 hypothetical protein C8N31_107138 [Sulfitobacter mediterraneus]UWR09640.1 hypothetical protein K3753_10005 [Sulfitobacter mediterraneus]
MADPVVIEMANKLAEECLAVQNETGEDRLFMEVGTVLGASSQTLEEAFLTAIRTRMANDKGRAFLAQKLKAHRAASGGS